MPLIEPVSSIGPLPGGGIPNSVSGGEDPTDSVPAGEGIEGKYLLKTEINGWLDHSTLGKFESTVTTYSLLLVEASNGVFYGREKQCYTDYLHVGPLGGCDEYDVGCIIYSDPDNPNSISTFVSQAVPQYTPAVVRIFDIQENGNWRTLRAPVAVGWNHQYEAETADTDPTTYVPREPPTSMDESLVAQWEDDNPGVTFRSEVNYCGESYSCETYAVQRVDPVYQGALSAPLAQGGAFNGGFVDGSRTVTNLLGASSPDCLDDGSSSAGARFVTENNLVLKRVERGDAGYFEGTGSPTVEWTCPPSELFMNP